MAQDAASGSAPRQVAGQALRAPELRALLADLDDLRLTLSADLGLAASAVDVGADEIARDVLAGAQDELAVFVLRSDFRLRDDGRPQPDCEAGAVAPAPVPRRRPRRLAVLAPALTAAAALVGLLSGVVPATGQPTGPQRTAVTNAAASYAELWRLHEQGAPAPRLARAARQLHAEVARLVGLTALDPATAEQALQLLELELQVLVSPQHGSALAAERAESQRLIAALRSAVQDARLGPRRLLVGRDAPVEPKAAAHHPADPAPARTAERAADAAAGTAATGGASAAATAQSAPRAQSHPGPERQQSADAPEPAPDESSPPAGSTPRSRDERDPRTWVPTQGRVVLPD